MFKAVPKLNQYKPLGLSFRILCTFSVLLILLVSNQVVCENKKGYLTADAGFVAPFGLVGGVGWAPISFVESYLQIGVIAFHTNTGMDQGLLDMTGFYTYAFSVRFRIAPFVGPKARRHMTIGATWRGFPAGTSQSEALDCLYCSDSGQDLDMAANTYLSVGYRVKALYVQFDYRVTSHSGTGSSWGYDPWHVGPSWFKEYKNISAPRVILYCAVYCQLPYIN